MIEAEGVLRGRRDAFHGLIGADWRRFDVSGIVGEEGRRFLEIVVEDVGVEAERMTGLRHDTAPLALIPSHSEAQRRCVQRTTFRVPASPDQSLLERLDRCAVRILHIPPRRC